MTTTLERPAAPAAVPAPVEVAAVPSVIRAEVRRQLGGARLGELFSLVGAVTASLATTWLLSSQLLPITGVLPVLLVAYVLFLVYYALLLSFTEPAMIVKDAVATAVIQTFALVVVGTLLFIVGFTIIRGAEALRFPNFFVQDMSLAGPLDPLSQGGILHAIVGSLIQITIALAITIPLGILTALYMNEMPGRFASFVRTVVEAMSALPSIVAGLFIYATVILILGLEKSGLAAAFAISVMMLPIMIRSSDVVIRMVPATLKEGAIGLGSGQWRTVWHVILPTARSGLTTAIILATARGIGETSPVLLTSGFTAALNLNPTSGPMISLPLAVFQFVKSPEPTMIARGFGAAAVLMVLVLVLFAVARWLGGRTIEKRERARLARIRRRQWWAAVLAPFGRLLAPVGRRLAAAGRAVGATFRRAEPPRRDSLILRGVDIVRVALVRLSRTLREWVRRTWVDASSRASEPDAPPAPAVATDAPRPEGDKS
ncbi:phosphate ABC transporter permease PstA [Chryseoglobus frigidaquae]|nr:phosphate ABC transporter permease PstA [Microcella frigidaquae]